MPLSVRYLRHLAVEFDVAGFCSFRMSSRALSLKLSMSHSVAGLPKASLSAISRMSVGSGCSIAFKLSSTLGRREGHLKVLSWGWLYLSSILDDYSRYSISWKLCSNMRAEDVPDTPDLALQASGYDQVAG
jgi:hypothetical protein